jgi:hypothetical protein
MRPREGELIDPEIAEQLDAIDATLAGEPVAPRFAELAELALMLSACKPAGPGPEFARELDGRVEGRFGAAAGSRALAGGGSAGGGSGVSSRRRARWWGSWSMGPMLGAGATAVAAVVIAVAVFSSGGGSSNSGVAYDVSKQAPALHLGPATVTNGPARATTSTAAAIQSVTGGTVTTAASTTAPGGKKFTGTFFGPGAAKAAPPAAAKAPVLGPAPVPASPVTHRSGAGGAAGATGAATSSAGSSAASSSAGSGTAASTPTIGIPSPAPLPNGRRIVQSSILELGTPAKRIDAVAQEVFTEVRAVNGIVESSNVSSTGGPGASAQFQLRVPSQYLADALTALSKLRYANVISRTDNTQDVNSPYLSLQREIAAAKAALVKLRAKLAAATTSTEIAILKQQIATENATLVHAQGSFQALNRQVDFSNLYVTLQATTGGGGVTPVGGGKGGFGLHQAGHDALRVLEVTAGVALIVLAALVPVGLLVALAWWLAGTLQRRRRERALDLA